jgi:hypothetical protein
MTAWLDSDRPRSLAAAPIVWLAHFVAVYALASLACPAAARLSLSPFGLSLTVIVLLTVVGIALSGYALGANLRKWRDPATDDVAAFLARTNVLLHGLGMVGMLWVALPAFLLPSCVS